MLQWVGDFILAKAAWRGLVRKQRGLELTDQQDHNYSCRGRQRPVLSLRLSPSDDLWSVSPRMFGKVLQHHLNTHFFSIWEALYEAKLNIISLGLGSDRVLLYFCSFLLINIISYAINMACGTVFSH